MPKYKFGDLVYNITEKRSPVAGDEEFYIGLEHLDSGSLKVTRWGSDVPIKGEKLVMKKRVLNLMKLKEIFFLEF